VHAGDRVKAGQHLISLSGPDGDSAIAGYTQAKAKLAEAQANDQKATKDLDRLRDLQAHSAAAEKDVLSAENASAQAQAALREAEAVAKQSENRMHQLGISPQKAGDDIWLSAPIAGVVVSVKAVPGELKNDLTTPVAVVADVTSLYVTADVPENAVNKVSMAQQVRISLLAYPDKALSARVVRVSDLLDSDTRTLKVSALVQNMDRKIKPGMFATLTLEDAAAPKLIVPRAAIIQDDGKNVVFVQLAPGRFERREAEVEELNNDLSVVRSGVKAGEQVVVDGTMLLVQR
jgi:cobalt-zinc-cadmium efflux system membrane fusion protein